MDKGLLYSLLQYDIGTNNIKETKSFNLLFTGFT